MDESIAQMTEVTGCTPEQASQFLQLADGNVDQAMTLFFDGGDLVGGTSNSHTQGTTSRPAGEGDSQNPISLDDDDDEPQISGVRRVGGQETSDSTFDADAEMARQMQEEMYGGTGGGGGTNGEEPIRAPIARQAQTLAGPGADYDDGPRFGAGPDFDNAEVQRQIAAIRGRRAPRLGIFNQQPTSTVWNDEGSSQGRDALAAATGGASEASSKSNMLARLFQPPWALLFKGGWDEAREEGRDQLKWLLVNIQNDSVFDCQVLNRDLWKNESVAETIRESFLFLQYAPSDPRAQTYINYYFQGHDNPDLYPHIAIVDPRTGEQVKVWSREAPKPPDFLMQIHEFLDRYSLASGARNPVAKRKPEPKMAKEPHQMTEDEMLEAAIAASVATEEDQKEKTKLDDPDELTKSIGDLGAANGNARGPMSEPAPILEDEEMASSTVLPPGSASIASDRPHTEPPLGPNVTRIQFRSPEAPRIIRRFALSDPVSRIYEWLKAEPLEGKAGAEFELVSMGTNLATVLDETIEQAALKNATVMVEFA